MTNEELAGLIQQGIDQEHNMEQLYIQNKGFIAAVLKRFRYVYQSSHDSLPIIEKEELMHEAYFGLIEAVKRYDPDQGANFLTYASLWINQVVKRFLDNSGRMIRIPVHTQEKYISITRQGLITLAITTGSLISGNMLPGLGYPCPGWRSWSSSCSKGRSGAWMK